MFVVIFNLLFMQYNINYSTLFNALVTIVNAGVGNFSYVNFDSIPDIRLAIFGKLFLVALIVVFLILMLNLIIAILTNVSNTYENLSTGLFLSKILSTREQLESDEYYGAFISAATPFNIFIIPFIPFGYFM
jgi:Polycystin cation channel